MPGVAAGDQALGDVLIEARGADVEQGYPREYREDPEWCRQVQRGVDQHQLVRSIRGVAQGVHGLAEIQRNQAPQVNRDDQGGADIEDDLDQIAPDDRVQPAHEGEYQPEQEQDKRRYRNVLRVNVKKQDHRDGDGREVEPRAAGEDPAQQVHQRRRPPRGGVKAGFEQLVHRRHPQRVEARDEHPGDDPRGQQGTDHA